MKEKILNMNKKTILIFGIIYALITFILRDVFKTTLGDVLAAISFTALLYLIVSFLYRFIKSSIRQFRYSNNKRNSDSDD